MKLNGSDDVDNINCEEGLERSVGVTVSVRGSSVTAVNIDGSPGWTVAA